MRFRNLSSIPIDAKLWRELASVMEVGNKLPSALADDLGLYIGNTLRVTIRPQLSRGVAHETASYVHGHISFYPCPLCTAASLTWTYLHELIHVWIEQYHEALYLAWDSCPLADAFADRAFQVIGGVLPSGGARCKEYILNIPSAGSLIPKLSQVVDGLIRGSTEEIKCWRELDILGCEALTPA